jgi:hypothetical protein
MRVAEEVERRSEALSALPAGADDEFVLWWPDTGLCVQRISPTTARPVRLEEASRFRNRDHAKPFAVVDQAGRLSVPCRFGDLRAVEEEALRAITALPHTLGGV